MDWIQQWQSKLNKQNGVAPLVRTGGSRHTGLAALPYRNIQCNEHGISPSCFYNAVTRLRKKVCQIPDPVGKASTLDLTSHKQDVVQIAIEPESSPAGLIPDNGNRPMHLDNSHTIEIEADGLLIRMSNEIKPLLLKMLMDTLKESLC